MKNLLLTGCDANYFPLAQGLVESVRRFPRLADHPFACLDLGLQEDQRRWLAQRNVITKQIGWDMDFPTRPQWEAAMPAFKGLVARPQLRDHFPGYQVYLWLDADTWLQQEQMIEHFVAAAVRGGIAIVPEIDRSYRGYVANSAQHWSLLHLSAADVFGREIAQRMQFLSLMNAGVFALAADSPVWALWRNYLFRGLQNLKGVSSWLFLVEQTALNAALYLHEIQVHRFSSLYNWMVHYAQPAWDSDSGLFVDPAPPWAPLLLIHMAEGTWKTEGIVSCRGRGLKPLFVKAKVDYPNALRLRAAEPQIRAAGRIGE